MHDVSERRAAAGCGKLQCSLLCFFRAHGDVGVCDPGILGIVTGIPVILLCFVPQPEKAGRLGKWITMEALRAGGRSG